MRMPFPSMKSVWVGLFLFLSSNVSQAQINWQLNFNDVNTGFNDPTLGATRRNTVTTMTNYINTIIDARGTVRMDLNSGSQGGALASAGTLYPDLPGFQTGILFQKAVSNRTPFSNNEGFADFDFSFNYNSGTGAPASDQFDLFSIGLHEFTHALGFASLAISNGSSEIGPNVYARYDRFLERGNGNDLFSTANGASFVGTAADLISDDVFWNGAFGTEANGGNRVRLFAPGSFQDGSSISHLRAATNSGVMNPSIGAGVSRRAYSGFEIGILLDLGYNNFEWNNSSGNWSDGIVGGQPGNLADSRWRNSALIPPPPFDENDPDVMTTFVFAPVGSLTHNLVMSFGGSGNSSYTSTNDLPANPFLVNRITLNSTSSATNTITGNAFEFGNDNGFNVAPRIAQSGSGAFNINNNIAIPLGLQISGSGTGNVSLGGNISGSGGITKTGNFTVFLNGNNTYSGLTEVTGGTLSGTGTISGNVSISSGATITPGTSSNAIGQLNLGSTTLDGGFYTWDVNSLPSNGTAGTNWDLLNITGSFTIGSNPSTLEIVAGTISGWDSTPSNPLTWTLIQTTSGISGSLNNFTLDTSNFGNTIGSGYVFSLLINGNSLVLTYFVVPEPGQVLLICFVGWVAYAKNRRRRWEPSTN